MRNDSKIKPVRLTKVATLEEYYDWLCNLVGSDRNNPLIKHLYNRDFVFFVPNDDNRAFEGKDLCAKFCEEFDIEYVHEYFEGPCSMLELIIGLAYRCESYMTDRDDSISMKKWFWMLLSNVGLDKFERNYESGQVDDILNRIIDRTYERDGNGGLFPLRFTKKDQRKVELWYQMCSYLVENYYKDEIFL